MNAAHFSSAATSFTTSRPWKLATTLRPSFSIPNHWGEDLDLDLEPTHEERAQAEREHRVREARTKAHPISVRAIEYTNIQLLDMLDVELHRAFPYSLEFVRPGFDELS